MQIHDRETGRVYLISALPPNRHHNLFQYRNTCLGLNLSVKYLKKVAKEKDCSYSPIYVPTRAYYDRFEEEQGFLATDSIFPNQTIFVDREKAMLIALAADQLLPRSHRLKELFSECVW